MMLFLLMQRVLCAYNCGFCFFISFLMEADLLCQKTVLLEAKLIHLILSIFLVKNNT